MKKIITDNDSLPEYFRFNNEEFRVNKTKDKAIRIIHYDFGCDINTYEIDIASFYYGAEVEPITKEEFEAKLNKAFQEILNA